MPTKIFAALPRLRQSLRTRKTVTPLGDCRRFSLSLGIQLLGICHRTIHASRAHIPVFRNPKQAIPTTASTVGDRIRIARLEQGVTRAELAKKLGVSIHTVKSWEWDEKQATACIREQIDQLLSLETV
jgi:DNA-binding transcriptional regulator YiaG